MEKLVLALQSRTNWTVVLIIAINVFNAFSGNIPADMAILINSVLGALAVYFKINPSQKY